MKRNNKKTILLMMVLMPILASAQETGASESYSEHFNPAMIISWLFIGLIILFTIVIYVLGKVLVSSTKEKMKRMAQAAKFLVLPILSVPSLLSAADGAETTISSGMGFNTVWNFWYLLIGILLVQLLIIIAFALIIRNNLRTETELKTAKSKNWLGFLGSGKFWDRFNNAKDLKEEKSILLDHDYDGIKELDNDLPPWWKYGFYFTILWGAVYLFYYHVSSAGISSQEEYEMEMAEAHKQVEAYKASMALNVDENTATLMTAASDIEAGRKVFEKLNCATCHMADGGGGIGPNLTDKYWLYGGSVNDVFKTIKYGANNGMKAWENDMSAVEMQQLSSYVLSLQGTTPADPKPAEGELYEPASGEENNADSTSTEEEITEELTIND